jgi:ribosome-binding protein aMBF1 (putative translation factor)
MNIEEKCETCGLLISQDRGTLVQVDGALRFLCRNCSNAAREKEANTRPAKAARPSIKTEISPPLFLQLLLEAKCRNLGFRPGMLKTKMLTVIASKYPRPVSREQVCQETGLNERTLLGYAYALQRNGLLLMEGDFVRIHPDVLLEAKA